MIPTNSQKRGVETFVVAKAAQTTLAAGGTTLSNSSTGNVNLNNGQLGIASMSPYGTVAMNTFIDTTPTFAEAPVIAIYQGTEYSQNVVGSTATYPLWVRPFEKTQDIDGRNNNIIVTEQQYATASHNIWSVGTPSAVTTGAINVVDNEETEYRLNVGFRSRRYDEMMATQVQTANLTVGVTTPKWPIGTADDLQRDYIVTHLGYQVNRNSKAFLSSSRYRNTAHVVAFAVGTDTSSGTAISSLTAGTTLAVFNYKGIVRSITITAEMLNSLLATGVGSGFTHIYTIDLANAGSTTGGTATGLFLMGLDHTPVYEDWIPQVKVNLQVGLPSGFDVNTVRNKFYVSASEGQGYGRQLDLWYKNTAGQRKYSQKHTSDPYINFPSPVDTAITYSTYIIHHGTTSNPDINSLIYAPKREVILIPTSNSTLRTSFETVMNLWLAATNNPAIKA